MTANVFLYVMYKLGNTRSMNLKYKNSRINSIKVYLKQITQNQKINKSNWENTKCIEEGSWGSQLISHQKQCKWKHNRVKIMKDKTINLEFYTKQSTFQENHKIRALIVPERESILLPIIMLWMHFKKSFGQETDSRQIHR